MMHLIFILLKIAFLASLYAALTLFILIWLEGLVKGKRAKAEGFTIWFLSGLLYSVLFFGYSFSHWGYKGLGDSYRLPLASLQEIWSESNDAYFYDANSKQVHITHFALDAEKLCALQDDGQYLVFDLKTKKITYFSDSTAYESFAAQERLPKASEFKDFMSQYHRYWNGWRYWLLP